MKYKNITKKPKITECYFCKSELSESDSYIPVDVKVVTKVFKNRLMCKSCQIINEDTLKPDKINHLKNLTVIYKRRNTQEYA